MRREKNAYRTKGKLNKDLPKAQEFGLGERYSFLAEADAPYLIEKVRGGLGMDEFHALQEMLEVSEERLAGLLGMSRATLHRRKKSGQLDRAESDRLVRYGRLVTAALGLFGSMDKAAAWLGKPAMAFGGEKPLDYADTEVGAREVEGLIGRLGQGVFS